VFIGKTALPCADYGRTGSPQKLYPALMVAGNSEEAVFYAFQSCMLLYFIAKREKPHAKLRPKIKFSEEALQFPFAAGHN
jgi:hypothetical protein